MGGAQTDNRRSLGGDGKHKLNIIDSQLNQGMIVFTQHAEEQMKIRKIDKKEVIDTLNNPDDLLYDVLEKNVCSC